MMMTSQQGLRDRLDALEQKLTDARAKLEFRNSLHDGHKLTNGELRARHAFLKRALDGEIADLELHGHRVSALEQDAINWINAIDHA